MIQAVDTALIYLGVFTKRGSIYKVKGIGRQNDAINSILICRQLLIYRCTDSGAYLFSNGNLIAIHFHFLPIHPPVCEKKLGTGARKKTTLRVLSYWFRRNHKRVYILEMGIFRIFIRCAIFLLQ